MSLEHKKLGRLHRTYNPRIPHLSAIIAGQTLPPPPPAVDYSEGVPAASLGMMLNDSLGDCTCAAVYHAKQIWSYNATQKIDTEPDSDVEALYIDACGYNPKISGEGPGGNEQSVLTYLLKSGAPVGPKGAGRDKILAFVEVDVRNTDDIKRTIADCGVVYIGFNVPQNIMPAGGEPPATWTVAPTPQKLIGGHAVAIPGYNAAGLKVISWGQYYEMTWDFFAKYVDEAYAIADQSWITAKGTTPGGLTLSQLEAQMAALKGT